MGYPTFFQPQPPDNRGKPPCFNVDLKGLKGLDNKYHIRYLYECG